VSRPTTRARARFVRGSISIAASRAAPIVPLFTLKTIDFVSKRVGNYQYSLQWNALLDQLWVR